MLQRLVKYFSFGLTAACLAVGLAALGVHRHVLRAERRVTREALDLTEVEELRALHERTARKTRSFLLTREARHRDELAVAEAELAAALELQRRGPQDDEAAWLLADLEAADAGRRAVVQRLLEGLDAGGLPLMLEAELQPLVDDLDSGLAALLRLQRVQMEEAQAEAARAGRQQALLLALTLALAVALAVTLAVWLRHALRRLAEAQRRAALQERLASLGTLAAGVGHEVANPLSYVTTNLRYVTDALRERVSPRDPTRPPRRIEDLLTPLADCQDGVERIARIVADLRLYARPRAASAERRALDVRRSVEWAARVCAAQLEERGRLELDLAPLPAVLGDETQLGQVFLNLLVNAAQALPAGARERHAVRVRGFTDARGQAVVEVTDTGTGIPPELLATIFDPFFTTKDPGVGTGLGLSICQAIVQSLGGDITVESAPGRGSTFRVVLPAAGAEAVGGGGSVAAA